MAQNKYSEKKGIFIHIYNLHYEKGENRMDVASLKTKDWRKEYSAFIGESKKVDYYTKKFEEMKRKQSKISFNIWGLLFNFYWCFYRKMLGWGCIGMGLSLGTLYLNFAFGWSTASMIVSLGLSLFFGFFGNYCYMNYVERSIARAINMDSAKKEKYYKENGGDGTKILLCMIFVWLVMMFALTASFGLPNNMI